MVNTLWQGLRLRTADLLITSNLAQKSVEFCDARVLRHICMRWDPYRPGKNKLAGHSSLKRQEPASAPSEDGHASPYKVVAVLGVQGCVIGEDARLTSHENAKFVGSSKCPMITSSSKTR
jgi:hypothetical protein